MAKKTIGRFKPKRNTTQAKKRALVANELHCDVPGCTYTSARNSNIERHKRSVHQDKQTLGAILQRLEKIEGIFHIHLFNV